jgi:hypothetical protein
MTNPESIEQIRSYIVSQFREALTHKLGEHQYAVTTLTNLNKQVKEAFEKLNPGADVFVESEVADNNVVNITVRLRPRWIEIEFTVQGAEE